MKMRQLSPVAAALGEALGFLALYLSREVEKPLLVLPLVGLSLSFFLNFRLQDRWLLTLVGTVAFATCGASFLGDTAALLTLSRALVASHALLWCAKNPDDYRYWRLGLAFLEVVLASILAPETYMLGLIFLFVVVASVALAFGFVERSFRQRDPALLSRPVSYPYLGAIGILSVVVFLSSLLIFPVLPRSQGLGGNSAQTGYTENVNFRSSTLGWASGSSRPLLWIFKPDEVPWRALIPWGLVRTKALEVFDGETWRPGTKPLPLSNPPASPSRYTLNVFREPLDTEALPVPYGASVLQVDGRARRRYQSGEWPLLGAQGKRVEYRVEVGADLGLNPLDMPRPMHLLVPKREQFPRLRALAAEMKRGTRDDRSRVRWVVEHLRGFRAEEVGYTGTIEGKVHPVEAFLFETRRGHCELFSTAAALLLREMGVPTRLVAGFRVVMPGDSTVLSVRNTHAHAWLEFYTREGGWQPIDPTPAVVTTPSWLAPAEALYDMVSAYWHRYILGYEMDAALFRALVRKYAPELVAAAGALTLILLAYALRALWRRFGRRVPVREKVGALFSRLESHRHGTALLATAEGRCLTARYEQLRFGRGEPSADELKSFHREVRNLLRSSGSGKEVGPSAPRG